MSLTRKQIVLLGAILTAVMLGGYAITHRDQIVQMISLVNENTPAPLFIALMIILPIFGVPISLFLLVLGIKFGLTAGLLLMFLVMPIHMTVSFALTKVAGELIQNVLFRGKYVIPQVPADRRVRFSFLVAALPLLPYAAKNFFLPLAGVPFRLYLGMNWACQATLAIPAVVLGSSIGDLNPAMFMAAVAGLLAIYLIIGRIEKKYGKHVDFKEELITGSRPDDGHTKNAGGHDGRGEKTDDTPSQENRPAVKRA
ncbi:MAG: hypothetical protein AB1724_01210 [Thermodesulfobacteriota bacterium]